MPIPPWLQTLLTETGLPTLRAAGPDVHLLLTTRLLRMFGYGASSLVLALFLRALGQTDAGIGLFMSLTLVGDVVVSLGLSVVADGLGRRKILVLGAVLMGLSGLVFATAANGLALLAAAVLGVVSPSGNEIGPFRAVEESTLAHLTDVATGGGGPAARADLFALYVVAGTLGTAVGSLGAGWVTQALQAGGWSELGSFRFVFGMYAMVGFVKAGLSMRLSQKCEVQVVEAPTPPPPQRRGEDAEEVEEEGLLNEADHDSDTEAEPPSKPPSKKLPWARISKKSRTILAKLCGLFFVDSLASGMIPGSLIAYYLERKFPSLPRGNLGTIIAASQFVSSLGNIFASSVAKRIGLVRTMVFTHLPSAIFLALIPVPSSLVLTIIFLIARSSLSSMDQAPRSAFLSAVVLPEERTAVMGIVNTVKTMSQSTGPTITGLLAGDNRFWIAFVIAGSLKASYDVAMLSMFVNTPIEGESRKSHDPDHSNEALSADGDATALTEPVRDDGSEHSARDRS